MRVAGIIPARLASTRLPRKVLREIAGRPLLQWVVEAAKRCPQLDEVVVAADSDEVAELCRKNGWRVIMTEPELRSGTDRLHAAAQEVDADIYVNIQGDEPLLKPEHIAAILRPFARAEARVATIKTLCSAEDAGNPNAVKVVTAEDGRALYFSRATIPLDRDGNGVTLWKHMGLYAYRREALMSFPGLRPSALEAAERLEQLRWLENGVDIYVEAVEGDTIGVDTEEDLRRVEVQLLAASS
jgi:3-deoxy-manno-octulosonate cytidylyltransferase (CMP-KDO synthetase)